MNFDDTARLLAQIAVVDSRPANRDVALYWAEILRDVDFRDASQAVLEHRRSSTEYLQPAHIFQGVQAIREARWRAFGGQHAFEAIRNARLDGSDIVNNPIAYRDAIRSLTEEIRSGHLTKEDAALELDA